uniref:Fanconi anaemia group A protein N-terminal domain-containing protein n=1 Tax=Anopheles farauti TaxID=69004 RepID=A0A182Q5L1_9DIPT
MKMGYAMVQHIVKETKRRISLLQLPYEEEYRAQLKHLGYKEKDIVREVFLRNEWNVGSARVLHLLQEESILTASEYMLSLDSAELTQQIMNDLLETEFTLLAHIVKYAFQDNVHSQSLSNVLRESFRSLIADLKENPNVIPRNYLHAAKALLRPAELKMIKSEHLQLLLIADQDHSNLEEAIGCQQRWREEMRTADATILCGLIVELVHDKAHYIGMLKQLIDKSSPFSLKYALYMLHVGCTVVQNAEVKLLKDFIKDLFRTVVDTGLMGKLQLLLLFAREICASYSAIMGTYSVWYKQMIGEMRYGVKRDEFIRTMELLTALLPLETDLEMLQVHASIAISAPAKCNDYVLNYKQLCRAQIAQLKAPDETIVLED